MIFLMQATTNLRHCHQNENFLVNIFQRLFFHDQDESAT